MNERVAAPSLRWRVLLVLALATVLPTALVGTLAIRRAHADLEREVVRGNLALIRALGDALDEKLQGARRSLDLSAAAWADSAAATAQAEAVAPTGPAPPAVAAATPAARELSRPRRGGRARDSGTCLLRSSGPHTSRRLLRRLAREVPLFASLSIVDLDGHLLYGDPVSVPAGAGAHSFGGYIGDVSIEDGRPRVRMLAQARGRTGELRGVLVAQLDLQFIADALGEARLGPGSRLLVVDGDGVPVATTGGIRQAGEQSLRGRDPAVDRALGSTTEGDLEAGGVVAVYRNLSSFQSLRGVRWSILLEQPTRDAYALARATTRDTLVAGALVLALSLALGAFLASRLTRPLSDLAARADAIAEGAADPADGTDPAATTGDPDPDPGGDPDTGFEAARLRAAPAAPLRAPGEIGHLARRIEEMSRRIDERAELQAALARGDRLAAVGTMAASVAHEVNNPLTTVLGYARLLGEDKPEDHPDRAGLDLIAGEAARMQRIVGSLLDYARSRPDPPTRAADVNQLVRRTADLMAPTTRRARIDLALELAPDLPRAAADPDAVQQVLVNLVQNAIQAMPEGGPVRITSALATSALATSALAAGAAAIEVAVIDRGPGVPPDRRERIFDTFYTTKQSGAGTGLGLAVCRHLVAGFRGRLAVDDAPGGTGACFRLVIPMIE